MAVNVKYCPTCEETLPITNFHKNPVRRDGYNRQCNSCRRPYVQEYYQKNKESYLEKTRDYQEKNREYYRTRNRENDRKLRVATLSHLRDPIECVHCFTDDVRILTIDHIHGGGYQERKGINQRTFYRKILAMDVEEARKKYRVLCRNCNWLAHLEILRGRK